MDPRRWQRLEQIFEKALERSRSERDAFLAAACGEDGELRRQVEEMLDADALEDGFLDATGPRPISALLDELEGSHQTSATGEEAKDAAPRRIGPYEIERQLGRGGMGVVYLARDHQLDRRVAIKTLPPELRSVPQSLERLEREARVLAGLHHPNLAMIHGLLPVGDERFLILEYVPGTTLGERLAERGALGLRETLRLGTRVAAGLAAAHRAGIVHRDLKPANIRLTPDGEVKVLDFGLAKPVSKETSRDGLTQDGAILGTVSYMSPEQALGRDLDARTDVWSFGCVLYECLTGRRAFADASPARTLDAIVNRQPDCSALPTSLPPALVRLLRRCLRKDREDRMRDLDDARLELEELLEEVREGTSSSAVRDVGVDEPRPRPGPTEEPLERHRGRRWAMLAVALLVAAGAGFFAGRGTAPTGATVGATGATARLSVPLPPEQAIQSAGFPAVVLSPDGRTLVYTAGRSLWRRDLDRLEAVKIDGTDGASLAFFSPDGAWIGFVAENRLHKVASAGGLPVRLSDRSIVGVGASWAEDGTIVFAPHWHGGLWRVPAAGGEAVPLTRPDAERGEAGHRWPHVLPGGKKVLYTVSSLELLSFDDAHIDLLDLETGERRTVVERGTMPFYLPSEGAAPGRLFYSSGHRLIAAPFDASTGKILGSPTLLTDEVDRDPITGCSSYAVAQDGTLAYMPRRQLPSREGHLVLIETGGQSGVEGKNARIRRLTAPDQASSGG